MLFEEGPTLRPSDLFGEGRRVGVFIIFDGCGAILAFFEEANEHRDESVLALCLNSVTIICVFGDDPATVETGVKPCVACNFHLKALPQRRDGCYDERLCAVELHRVFHEDVRYFTAGTKFWGWRGFVGINEFGDQILVCGLEQCDIGLKVGDDHVLA